MTNKKTEIFEKTLTTEYNHSSFVDFIREVVTGIKLSHYNTELHAEGLFFWDIIRYFQIGDFSDDEGNRIGIFSVELRSEESVERARSKQRSFVKTLLENGNYAAALVAFYSEGNEKWRFSFVRMDYEFAKGKIKENLTPARRYSYLVGNGEPCHTAMDRLLPIFMDDSKKPSIDVIEEAFSVEKVTKDFFEAYKEKYLEMKEFLESNEDFIRESQIRHFTSEQFTKKLLSQIVFLYFIQKKGWLGVNAVPKMLTEKEYKNAFFSHGSKSRDLVGKVYYQDGGMYRLNVSELQSLSAEDETIFSTCVKGQPWGTGPKNFMRMIFTDCTKRGKNFFDDYLEPLFYTGLNQDRGENAFFPPLHCRIPFLNGGLFEELDHYDWKYNNFDIPNEIFSNVDEKGRLADGILDIFDRYNFTMAEDEPLEKEVAVDPEMLGKVFENLLDVKDRKSTGSFYTPREIVHYMCQESLINYLTTKSGIPEDDIRKFITLGEFFKDEDARRTKKDSDGKYYYDYDKSLEIPSTILDFKNDVNRLEELDNLLVNVKCVDPAVGSGAFPLGLLNEIVKARQTLTTYMAIPMNKFERVMLYANRSAYQLKTQTIKNCIFACDLEPSAADITKLRLWLALVIEDEITEENNITLDRKELLGIHSKPRKLPNLDCNVLCGNSLNDTFEGVKLICNTEALGNAVSGSQISIADRAIQGHINSLIELQDNLYNASSTEEKEEIKKHIQIFYDAIIVEQLESRTDLKAKYVSTDVRNADSKPFILWQLYFPKVFKENGGFDICIGNPPYVQLQKSIDDHGTKLGDMYEHLGYKSFVRKGDLYCLFYEKGCELLNHKGTLIFITSNKWLRANYGKKLRSYFIKNINPKLIIDLANVSVFETATVDVNILMLSKEINQKHTNACIVDDRLFKFNLSNYVQDNLFKVGFTSDDGWVLLSEIEKAIQDKLESKGKPLSQWAIDISYGVKTGLNEAFLIDDEKKKELVSADPNSEKLIYPVLKGKDMSKYVCSYRNIYIILAIFDSHKWLQQDYPAIYRHLLQYEEQLKARGQSRYSASGKVNLNAEYPGQHHWLELDNNPREPYVENFKRPKIIFQEIVQEPSFVLDIDKHYFCLDTGRIINGEMLEYLVGLLNSKLFFFAIKSIYGGGGLGGHAIRMKSTFFERFPAVVPSQEEYEMIKKLYYSDEDRQRFDSYISSYLYKKYDLSDEEILYIENCFDKGE